jgi:hypothetical protein
MYMMENKVPINLILGFGRSGTTWLGSIINSHPDVAYRFEPFHRLKEHDPNTMVMFKQLAETSTAVEALPDLYKKLIVADPLTLKPPFFEKNYIKENGIEKMWAFSRAFRPGKLIYSMLYTPRNATPTLVVKEVCFEERMKGLLSNTNIPIVYLVRHPCGCIFSNAQGQQDGKMKSKRNKYLGGFMHAHAPELYERYGSDIEHMSVLENIAWFWRISLDLAFSAIQETGRGKILTYEQLCDDPATHTKEILDYFGLYYHDETKKFINGLYSEYKDDSGKGRKKDMMNGYFTVYRDPSKQKDAWKAKISQDDRKTIERIVKDSPAFEYFAALGHWD